MRRVAAKFIPRLMAEDKKTHRLEVFQNLLEMANPNGNFSMSTTWKPRYNRPSESSKIHQD